MQSVFRRCLSALDVDAARLMWSATFPHLPPLGSDADILAMLHRARTEAESSPEKDRLYSHRWLIERGIPSGLPDRMKAKADRIYPEKVMSVGVATKTRSCLANAVHDAMVYAVNECYGDGHQEPHIVRPRMLELRARVLRQ